jgi:hypothetical protein
MYELSSMHFFYIHFPLCAPVYNTFSLRKQYVHNLIFSVCCRGLKNVEGSKTQIGLQKQLYEQLEVSIFFYKKKKGAGSFFYTQYVAAQEKKTCTIAFSFVQIQRKLQLQVEEHSKYLEIMITKQSESLKKPGALRGCQDRSQPVSGNKRASDGRPICSDSEPRK